MNLFSRPKFFSLLMLSLWGIACTGVNKVSGIQDQIAQGTARIQLDSTGTDSIRIFYTGCAGFMIQKDDQVILHDPFFSNIGPLLSVPFQKPTTDTAAIRSFFRKSFSSERDSMGKVKLLLVSHTHYDHMMDVPVIYHEFLNKDSVQVLGNDGMVHIMRSVNPNKQDTRYTDPIISVEDNLTEPNKAGARFASHNKRVSVLPVATSHAPHFWGVHYFKGKVKIPSSGRLTKARHWKEGTNIAYLVDFLNEQNEIDFRIYLSGAAFGPSDGLLPTAILEEHPIDLAIICAASHGYVKGYPEALLNHLNPRHIVLSHWENFFQPNEKLEQRPMGVPFTNVKRFVKKVDKTTRLFDPIPAYTIPNVGTEMLIYY